MYKYIVILFLLSYFTSCEEVKKDEINIDEDKSDLAIKEGSSVVKSVESLKSADYLFWVENSENGINKQRELNEFQFNLQYKPYNYIVLLNNKNEKITDEKLNEEKENLKGLQYYTLSIKVKDSHIQPLDYLQYSKEALLKYFSFDMEKDLKLVEGRDTFSCVLFHFERTYGMTPWNSFSIGFEANQNIGEHQYNKTLIFDDKVFGTGTLKISIRKEDLNKIPDLIL